MRLILAFLLIVFAAPAIASPLKFSCVAKKGERVTVKTDEDRTNLEVISGEKKDVYDIDADRALELASDIQFSSYEVRHNTSARVHYLSVGQLLIAEGSDKAIRIQMTITVIPQTEDEPVTTIVYNCK